MTPTHLNDWNYEGVTTLCAAGQSESERHDFKAMLPEAKKLTKLCCAFANSSGGFVIVGVGDKQPFQIIGVDPDKELFGKFVGKVRASPDIPIDQPKPIAIPGSTKLLYVFEIKQSQRSPHLPIPANERIFWKRQGPSCAQMTLEEIRYQMNNYEEKREKLALLMMDFRHKVEAIDSELLQSPGGYSPKFVQMYTFDIIDRVLVDAYSFLKADPLIFKQIDGFKSRISELNGAKQRMIATLATRTGSWDLVQADAVRLYHGQLTSVAHEVKGVAQSIRRSIRETSGIDDPIAPL